MATNKNFKATIYKLGINLCVDVPTRITANMTRRRGYVPVTGTINKFPFVQTLVPVRDAPFRLFVNTGMIKGSGVVLGNTASFTLQEDVSKRTEPVPASLLKALKGHQLLKQFRTLIPSRQKEILRYLNNLKTPEARERNINKVIAQLKGM